MGIEADVLFDLDVTPNRPDAFSIVGVARDLAAKLGVHPTPPKDFAMAKDHAAAVAKLEATSGKAFDRAFLQHEVAFHKAVLDAVKSTLLPALQNPEARALVTKVAPAFEAHMLAAQNLLDKQGTSHAQAK
jgi:putative membrane protein